MGTVHVGMDAREKTEKRWGRGGVCREQRLVEKTGWGWGTPGSFYLHTSAPVARRGRRGWHFLQPV